MFNVIENQARRLGKQNLFDQLKYAFIHRQGDYYNPEGVTYRDVVRILAAKRELDERKRKGDPMANILNFEHRNPRTHEVFLDTEEELKLAFSFGGLAIVRYTGRIDPEFMDSYPDLVYLGIQPKAVEVVQHETAHKKQLEGLEGVTTRYGISFSHNLLTNEPHLAGHVIISGNVPIDKMICTAEGPDEPSGTDAYIAKVLRS